MQMQPRPGRRPCTTRTGISRLGLELFATHGFDETSMDEIADAAGISRRTLFRYFPSKNDIAWGDFDTELTRMRTFLAALPTGTALPDALCLALVDFNTFPPPEVRWHRRRMALLLEVPALQAHSVLKYAGWRQVVAEHVAQVLGTRPTDHLPRSVAWMLLGIALAAYEQWLADESQDLLELLRTGADLMGGGLQPLRSSIR
ncbi:MAG: mycofactocin system transcriptional regulator [Mycobacteriaceae bacterium]